jgi:tetratricopeptide (TPR) repeat protein
MVALNQHDRASSRRYLEEELPLYERLGDHRMHAEALLHLAWLEQLDGKFERARQLLREIERIAAENGDRYLLARAAGIGAHIPLYQGDLEQAERMFREALRRAREAEVEQLEKNALINLGSAVLEQGQLDEAASLFRQSLSIRLELSRSGSEVAVEGLAAVAVVRGDAATAARLLGATEQWHQKTGFRSDPFESARADRTAAAAREALGDDTYRDLTEQGARLELDAAVELALTISSKTRAEKDSES